MILTGTGGLIRFIRTGQADALDAIITSKDPKISFTKAIG